MFTEQNLIVEENAKKRSAGNLREAGTSMENRRTASELSIMKKEIVGEMEKCTLRRVRSLGVTSETR